MHVFLSESGHEHRVDVEHFGSCSMAAPKSFAGQADQRERRFPHQSDFVHEPILESDMRLLSFVPTGFSILSMAIETFDRSRAPLYTALSYEWGTGEADHEMTLNKARIAIRPNLQNALYCLKQHMSTKYIWIDAICINQTNIPERNQQVRAMGMIYSQAKQVIAWLGLYDDTLHGILAPRPDDAIRTARDACRALAEKTYWTRQWIWQELLLSRDTLLLCGHYVILLDTFRYMARHHLEYSSGTPGHLLNIWAQPGKYSLFHALTTFDFCQCRDPRDKVFAVLNLFYPDERAMLSTLPDYSLSLEQVAHIAIRHIRVATLHGIHGQSELCKNAEQLLCALGAERCEATKRLADALQSQVTDLRVRTRDMRKAMGLKTPMGVDRRKERGGPFVLPDSLAPRCRVSEGLVPGTALTMLSVFDAVFGWQEGRENVEGRKDWEIGIWDNGLAPDIWSIDEL